MVVEVQSSVRVVTGLSPSLSVITVFLSGSVPGEYSTVLSTVTVTQGVRRRREALVTQRALQPATSGSLGIDPTPVGASCQARTPVTVTVTETMTCDVADRSEDERKP